MPIVISEYRSAWAQRFIEEAARIRDVLGPVAVRVEHVGSTAVPGLAAKNTVDIQISVSQFEPEDRFRHPLESLGYVFRPDDEPQHRFFKLEDENGRRLVHLHVCERGSDWERRHIAFRDHLRKNRKAARDYEQLKKALAPKFEDANEYAEAKGDFIRRVMAAARTDTTINACRDEAH